jgi:cell division protein FtsB
MKKLLSILKNKYYISLGIFIVYMLVFDRNDLKSQYENYKELKLLEDQRAYYIKDIAIMEKDFSDLTTDQNRLEQFGREKYLMKKDNEDVFVIVKIPRKDSLEKKKRFYFF